MKNANLITRLVNQTSLTTEQAKEALVVIADYAKEKFPILRGTIQSFVQQELKSTEDEAQETKV